MLRGREVETALGLGWALQNFTNIARYLGDARTQALPLVGGGLHDWALILDRWDILAWDRTLAGGLIIFSRVGFFLVAAWVLLPRQPTAVE